MRSRLPRTFAILSTPLVLLSAAASPCRADSYANIPISALDYTASRPLFTGNIPLSTRWRAGAPNVPRVVLQGEGEAYVSCADMSRWNISPSSCLEGTVHLRIPQGRRVEGTVYLQDSGAEPQHAYRFSVPEDKWGDSGRNQFLSGKEKYYRLLFDLQYPGAAWFRHQLIEVERERKGTATTSVSLPPSVRQIPGRTGSLADTFDLFSGGRAVSENLQLDRDLILSSSGAETVPVSTVPGITVQEIDWTQHNKGKNPELDPLAAHIPADQYAVLFPSLTAMIELTDQLNKDGDEILPLVEPRPEDAMTRERYQAQLVLPLSDLARMFGPYFVRSVAVTGSDPYFRTGTDIAVLFEGKEKAALVAYVDARYALARTANPSLEAVTGEIDSVRYHGIKSADRRISSLVAELGETVVVTNSAAQLKRLAAAFNGKTATLASLGEYRFFRDRYRRSAKDESAFVIVPDAAIRKWGGAEWRIAASRRTRAAALMSEIQAEHLAPLAKGAQVERPAKLPEHYAPLGEVSFNKDGVYSSRYGSLGFLTPIAELEVKNVSSEEAEAYKRFRDTYQSYWRGYFDPIGASISFLPGSKSVDISVMPLILGSDYRPLINLSPGKYLDEYSGDPHDDAIIGVTLALDATAGWMRFADGWGQMVLPNVTNPLGWIGSSISVYLDDGPLVKEVEAADDKEKLLEDRWHQIPIGIFVEVNDSLKLTAFLTALRAMAEQSAPGISKWENLDYHGVPYVKVSEGPSSIGGPRRGRRPEWGLYYAATSSALIVSLREEVVQRALDRLTADSKGARPHAREFVKDNSATIEVSDRFVNVAQGVIDKEQSRLFEDRCYANIPILNEWKRRFPERDPVELHAQLWNTKLLCPAGGEYRWNEQWQTMESTVLGHPGEPKKAAIHIPLLARMKHVQMGVKFELDGVRAKVKLREPGVQ